MKLCVLLVCVAGILCGCESAVQPKPEVAATQPVGPVAGTNTVKVATGQLIHPVGQSVEYHGRPVDLALSRDGKIVFVKDAGSLLAIDAASWKILDQAK